MSLYTKTSDIQTCPDMSLYTKTSDIQTCPDMSLYTKTSDIQTCPDMSLYTKTADIPSLSENTTVQTKNNKIVVPKYEASTRCEFKDGDWTASSEATERCKAKSEFLLKDCSDGFEVSCDNTGNAKCSIYPKKVTQGDMSCLFKTCPYKAPFTGTTHTPIKDPDLVCT